MEYKPENEDKKMIEVDKKVCMDIEKNYIDDKNKENNKNEQKKIYISFKDSMEIFIKIFLILFYIILKIIIIK